MVRRLSATTVGLRCSICNGRAIPCAFDLLEVNGEDIRKETIEDRKRRLAGVLRLPHSGIALDETYREDGAIIFKHACALGCEGIVSKRLGSPHCAGRWNRRIKSKEPSGACGKARNGRGLER
jgi:ATP-dependent DNA ligase